MNGEKILQNGIKIDLYYQNLNMQLDSEKIVVNKSSKEVFEFLSKVENFEKLMPENISKFEVLSEDSFLFALKGMPEIALKTKELVPPNKIVLGAAGGKIDFSLIGNINALNQDQSEVSLTFTGDFNPMMAMMIKGPITKFLETLSTNIPKAI